LSKRIQVLGMQPKEHMFLALVRYFFTIFQIFIEFDVQLKLELEI
jgi:hypothetical protein